MHFFNIFEFKKFDIPNINIQKATNIFKNIEELKYCYDNNINQFVKNQLTGESVCEDPCFINSQNKFIISERECIEHCYNSTYFQYEYNNICYSECPYWIHHSTGFLCEDIICFPNYNNLENNTCIDRVPDGYFCNNEELRTIEKCDNKCEKCSKQSHEKNLCVTCNANKGFFPKEKDSSNIDGFMNCYDYFIRGLFFRYYK